MRFLDKFLDAVKVNDDFDDDEFLDEEDEGFEEEKPKRRFFRKLDDDLDDDLEELHPKRSRTSASSSRQSSTASSRTPSRTQRQQSYSSSKVTPIDVKRRGGVSTEVCVMRPKKYEDATEVVDALVENCTVILNLEGMDVTLAQHIIDFTAGASYSLEGNISKVSSYIFVLSPQGVDITGDSQELMNDIVVGAAMY